MSNSSEIVYDIPCTYCEHKAYRHFQSIASSDQIICLDCVPDKEKKKLDCWHSFTADNLKYLENKEKEKEINTLKLVWTNAKISEGVNNE